MTGFRILDAVDVYQDGKKWEYTLLTPSGVTIVITTWKGRLESIHADGFSEHDAGSQSLSTILGYIGQFYIHDELSKYRVGSVVKIK